MPNWRPINRALAISRGTYRSRAVLLWYADDIELVNGAAPNTAALYASFGLPPLGAPNDFDLPGAIVVDHQLVGPCLNVNGLARATVAVFYDSAIRFRFDPTVRSSVRQLEPIPTSVAVVRRRTIGQSQVVERRQEFSVNRSQWMLQTVKRTTGDAASLAATIAAQVGKLYVISGIPYLLNEFGINDLGNGQIELVYGYWSMASVRAVTSGTFGTHIDLPALGNLDTYAVDEEGALIGVRAASDAYLAGGPLP